MHGEKERRWKADGTRSLSVSRSLPQTACQDHGIGLEAVCVSYATGSRLRITKDVSVLRVNHAAVEDVLPGVREVPGSGHDQIKIKDK